MVAKRFFYVSAGLLCLALVYHFGARSATAQAPGSVRSPSTGRWAIVNGTPEMTRNIMLLDTATGQSWNVCTDAEGGTGWCYMPRTMASTVRDSTR